MGSPETITDPATTSWTLPAGATLTKIAAVAAGFSGASSSGGGIGGAGGSYYELTTGADAYSPGQQFDLQVGIADAGFQAGSDSGVSVSGTPILMAAASEDGTTGGQTSDCLGDTGYNGGDGGATDGVNGGDGGSPGTSAADGTTGGTGAGAGGQGVNGAGGDGTIPGAGGGGSGTGLGFGGAGQNGSITFYYTSAASANAPLAFMVSAGGN